MRPHTGQQQQQSHHQQQYCAVDNCLKQQQQQQHFLKNHQSLQQQHTATHLQQQQKYHQHQLQQHSLNHALQQQQPPPPPPHMWNPHLNAACYTSQSPSANTNGVNSTTNPNHINLQNCRPFPSNRVYPHHTQTPHYPPSNGFPHALPTNNPQATERIPLTAPNYAKLPPLSVVNQQRINECAGIPLISTATAHLTPGQRQRISRKQSHSPPGKNWTNMLPGNTAQNYAAAAQYAAAHVQGAPLMLNKPQQQKPEYWSSNTYTSSNNQQPQFGSKTMQYNNKQQDRTRTPLRYQNSAPAALSSSKSKENLDQQLKHSKDNENSSSNNGDSSNSNETCLPRIIKPRKRRKKDRKPPNNLVNAVYLKIDNKSLQDKSSNIHNNTIKTYKSSEDLLKCLQKFTQITNSNEQPQRCNSYSNKTGLNYDLLAQNKKELQQKLSLCTSGSDINHGICFCNECDPLRSIWDYPLRRSLSDSSTSDTSGTGSLSDNTTTSSNDSEETNWPKTRAEIVGVIGSKRNKDQQNSSNNSNHLMNKADNTQDKKIFNNNILSGINLSSELFKNPNSDAFANLDHAFTSANDNMLLLPETAETLLTKSINEISKKLIETCSNESGDLPLSSCNSLSSFSTTSSNSSSANSTCADFSNDSGIESAHINAGDDLVFNFDNLHITTTKLSLSPSSLSAASSTSSSSSSTSSCGNISMSSSPTVKFASNFLTTQTSSASATATAASVTVSTMQQTPLTPSNVVLGTTIKAAPTLDFLVDLNNNHLHVAVPKPMIVAENKQLQQQQLLKQQFNDLVQKHQPPHQQLTTTSMPTPTPTHRHDQQFFNNCFDLMWQQHERQLGNNNIVNTTTSTSTATTSTTNNNSNHIDQLTSSALTSNNVAMSSFLDSVGSLKTVFSTIS
ncbi:protein kinase 4 [Lucilia cuprina]|uniref:protein kinase 4 n=1 Tax=Lucilia cuprina TaxID=7375 RepID=UPI001F05CB5B|nr:protein kinase 4 [Lucilia cuprina]